MLYIGSDHAGYLLKEKVKVFLHEKKVKFKDVGNTKYEPTDDYPVYGYKLAKLMKKNDKGILICGSSFGVCIVANKVKGIRAASIATKRDAKLSRQDDDANVCCLSGRHTSYMRAKSIITTFLNTQFSKEERHRRRVEEIGRIERGNKPLSTRS